MQNVENMQKTYGDTDHRPRPSHEGAHVGPDVLGPSTNWSLTVRCKMYSSAFLIVHQSRNDTKEAEGGIPQLRPVTTTPLLASVILTSDQPPDRLDIVSAYSIRAVCSVRDYDSQ